MEGASQDVRTLSPRTKAEIDDAEKIQSILRDTGLIQLPVDIGHEQLREVKLKLDGVDLDFT